MGRSRARRVSAATGHRRTNAAWTGRSDERLRERRARGRARSPAARRLLIDAPVARKLPSTCLFEETSRDSVFSRARYLERSTRNQRLSNENIPCYDELSTLR